MLLKTNDLQKRLGISRETTYRLMRSESFPSMKLGARYYVAEEKLDEWLKKQPTRRLHCDEINDYGRCLLGGAPGKEVFWLKIEGIQRVQVPLRTILMGR